jgi:DNA-binding NarL/FixJ family response regulator
MAGIAGQAIASRLSLTLNMVRHPVAIVYSRLNVHRRAETIVWAGERHLLANQGAGKRWP